jgi:hypothetical protein
MAKVQIGASPEVENDVEVKSEEKKKWELIGDELHVYLKDREVILEELNGLQALSADKMSGGDTISLAFCRTIFAVRKIGDRKFAPPKDNLQFNLIAQTLKSRELDRLTEAYFTTFNDSMDTEVKN